MASLLTLAALSLGTIDFHRGGPVTGRLLQPLETCVFVIVFGYIQNATTQNVVNGKKHSSVYGTFKNRLFKYSISCTNASIFSLEGL